MFVICLQAVTDPNCKVHTEDTTCRKVTGVKQGVTMGEEMGEVHVPRGNMKRRKEVRVDVSKGKPITRRRGRKESNNRENDQIYAKRRSYSEAVIEGSLGRERVFMGDSILRKTDKTLSKGEDVVVC